jgi:hypothetical protein
VGDAASAIVSLRLEESGLSLPLLRQVRGIERLAQVLHENGLGARVVAEAMDAVRDPAARVGLVRAVQPGRFVEMGPVEGTVSFRARQQGEQEVAEANRQRSPERPERTDEQWWERLIRSLNPVIMLVIAGLNLVTGLLNHCVR